MEEAVLASLIPAPSQYALLHDFPKACRAVLRRRLLDPSIISSSAELLTSGFEMCLEMVLKLKNELDKIEHQELVKILVELVESPGVAASVNVDVGNLVTWMGATSDTIVDPWVAALLFEMISHLIPARLGDLCGYIADYIGKLPLGLMRLVSQNYVSELCSKTGIEGSERNLLFSKVGLLFVKSTILQRRLDGIGMFAKLDTVHYAKLDLIKQLLSLDYVHEEVIKRMQPLVESLAEQDFLRENDIDLIWSNGDYTLLYTVASALPIASNFLETLMANAESEMHLVKSVAVAEGVCFREQFNDLCQRGVFVMWNLEDDSGLLKIKHAELLQLLVTLCMSGLDTPRMEFSVKILSKLPASMLDIEVLSKVFFTSDNIEDQVLYKLGSQIVTHQRSEEQKHEFIVKVAGSKKREYHMFVWLTDLSEAKVMSSSTARFLFDEFNNKDGPQEHQNATWFKCIRSLFLLQNIAKLNDLRTTIQDDSYFTNVKPLCFPSELYGIGVLWKIAVNSTDNSVTAMAVDALQTLFDPSADDGNPQLVKTDYVATCTKRLQESSSKNSTMRCLGFIEALLNEADQRGTRGYRSHGARQRGHIHSLLLTHEESTPTYNNNVLEISMYSNATVWDIRSAVSNRLVEVNSSISYLPDRISLRLERTGDENIVLDSKVNAKTLGELGFKLTEILRYGFIDDITRFEKLPRVRLLDHEGLKLTQPARNALGWIFEEYATSDASFCETGEPTKLMSENDFVELFKVCTGAVNLKAIERRSAGVFETWSTLCDAEEGATKYLSKEDFLSFYENAARGRPSSVWKDLVKHGFNHKLEHEEDYLMEEGFGDGGRVTSEFRMSMFDDINNDDGKEAQHQQALVSSSWRSILASNNDLYETLFRLLQHDDTSVVRLSWSILLRLPTWREMLSQVKMVEFRQYDHNERIALYLLHIMVSFMEQDESKVLLENHQQKLQSSQVEQHIQRARRASFELPPTMSNNSKKSVWTEQFIGNGGVDYLMNLLKMLDLSGDSVDQVAQLVELTLKAVKLVLTFTKVGRDSRGLDGLSEETRVMLVSRIRTVLDLYCEGKLNSAGAADHALFLWDFIFSWLSRRPEDDHSNEILHSYGALDFHTKLINTSRSNEAMFVRRIWQKQLVDTIIRISSRFPVIRDRYVNNLIERYNEIDGWLSVLLVELLKLEPKSSVLEFDVNSSFLDSVTQALLMSKMSSCVVLAALIKESDGVALTVLGKDKMQQIVTRVAHQLLAPEDSAFKTDMLQLLVEVSKTSKSMSRRVAQVILLPLLRTRDPVQPQDKHPQMMKYPGRVGLVNLGNTCYINSLLQQIAVMPPVLQMIFDLPTTAPSSLLQLQRTLGFLTHSDRGVFSTTRLVKGLKINPHEQQDCEEFLSLLMDKLEVETPQKFKDIFDGAFETKRECKSCGKVSIDSEETGTDLAVDVITSVKESLNQTVFRAEVLDGFVCEECNVQGKVTQRKGWKNIPNVLILHLKRFRFDLEKCTKVKITKSFLFEETLFGKDLTGIVCHRGSAEAGHYYSYVKDGGKWFELNDCIVREVDGFPTETYQSAYLLFYNDIEMCQQDRKNLVLPKSLQFEIDSDNFVLQANCIISELPFWELCLVAMRTLSNKKSNKRASIGASTEVLEPQWWPTKSTDDSEGVATKASSSKKSNVVFIVNLVRVISTYEHHGTDTDKYREVCSELLDLIVASCLAEAEVLIEVMQTVTSLCVSGPVQSNMFSLVSSLLNKAMQEDQVILRKMLLRDPSFVEAGVACANRDDDNSDDVILCMMFLILIGDGSVEKHEQDTIDWVFTSDKTIVHTMLERARELIPDDDFLDLVERMSQFSMSCAEMSTLSIAKQVISNQIEDEEDILLLALETILEANDEFAEVRFRTILSMGSKVSERLESVLQIVETERKLDATLYVVETRSAYLFFCSSDSNSGTVAASVVLQVEGREEPIETLILPLESKLLHVVDKPVADEGLKYAWDCRHEGERSKKRQLLGRSRSSATVGSDDLMKENDFGAENVVVDPEEDNNESLKTIKGMGFTNVESIKRALHLAKGNEQIAIEFLLTDTFTT